MISIAIMHRPDRELEPMLLERLQGLDVSVVDAPGLSLWECAQTAWGLAHGRHHFVLHDDVRPCVDFAARLRGVVTVAPDVPLCLWGSRPDPAPRGSFLAYDTFSWGGGLGLPSWMIPDFLDWCECIDPARNMDDTRFTLWCCARGWSVHVPVPNLIQHPAHGSLVRPGIARSTAAHFEEDPGEVRWGAGTVHVPGDRKAFLVSRRMHFTTEPLCGIKVS